MESHEISKAPKSANPAISLSGGTPNMWAYGHMAYGFWGSSLGFIFAPLAVPLIILKVQA